MGYPFSLTPSIDVTANHPFSTRRLLLVAAIALTLASSVVRAGILSGTWGPVRAGEPDIRVYAWSKETKHLYTVIPATAGRYALTVAPGHYWVFASLEGPGAPVLYAAYTSHARCTYASRDNAAKAPENCESHDLTEVAVGRVKVDHIDLTDWALDEAAASTINTLLGRPAIDPYDQTVRAAPKFSEYPSPPSSYEATIAREAYGYHETDKPAAQAALTDGSAYAGHWTLIDSSCGASCAGVALLNRTTGEVSYPSVLNPLPEALPCESRARLQYRRDSRLLIIKSNAGKSTPGLVALDFFTLDEASGTLRLITRQNLPDASIDSRCNVTDHATQP